jgi:hypothetical protein
MDVNEHPGLRSFSLHASLFLRTGLPWKVCLAMDRVHAAEQIEPYDCASTPSSFLFASRSSHMLHSRQ